MKFLIPFFLFCTTLLLSGCVEGDGPPELTVDPPRLGERFIYEAQEGSRLEIHVKTVENRSGPYLQLHESLIVEYNLHIVQPGEPFVIKFEEAISLDTGLTIHTTNVCGGWGECPEVGFTQARFGTSGLPGALGMGPLWARERYDRNQPMELHHPLFEFETSHLQVEDVRSTGSACIRLSYSKEFPDLHIFRSTMTGLSEYSIYCPGHSLPREFKTFFPVSVANDRHLTFRLTDSTPSAEEVIFNKSTESWKTTTSPFTFNNWTKNETPYLFNDSQYLEFSMPEAHQEALRMDPGYRRLFNSSQNPILTDTISYLSYTMTPGWIPGTDIPFPLSANPYEVYTREISVTLTDGPPRLFILEKKITDPAGEREISYSMVEPDDQATLKGLARLDPDRFSMEQADPIGVLGFFSEFYGSDPDHVAFGHRVARLHSSNEALPEIGYEIRAFKRTEGEPGSNVVGTIELSVDGRTGSILRMDLPR